MPLLVEGCKECKKFSGHQYDEDASTTYEKIMGDQIIISEDGFKYKGDLVEDTVCLGNGDVHTTVCLDSQTFYTVKDIAYDDWVNVIHDHAVIQAVFGLGYAEPDANS